MYQCLILTGPRVNMLDCHYTQLHWLMLVIFLKWFIIFPLNSTPPPGFPVHEISLFTQLDQVNKSYLHSHVSYSLQSPIQKYLLDSSCRGPLLLLCVHGLFTLLLLESNVFFQEIMFSLGFQMCHYKFYVIFFYSPFILSRTSYYAPLFISHIPNFTALLFFP